jgi:hypothetical protein
MRPSDKLLQKHMSPPVRIQLLARIKKTQQFSECIHRYVIQFAPPNADPLRFGGRSPRTIYDYIKINILPDVQKFSPAINIVKRSINTGNPSEVDIHCMAIAHHLRWVFGADPSYMTNGKQAFNPSKKWDNYLAYLELRKNPKFFESPSAMVQKTPNEVSMTYNTIDNGVSDLSDGEGSKDSGSEKSKVAQVVSSDSCIYKSRSGQKRAKLELKEQAANKEHQKNNASVTTSIASIALSQAGMYNLMQLSESCKIFKNVKGKI